MSYSKILLPVSGKTLRQTREQSLAARHEALYGRDYPSACHAALVSDCGRRGPMPN